MHISSLRVDCCPNILLQVLIASLRETRCPDTLVSIFTKVCILVSFLLFLLLTLPRFPISPSDKAKNPERVFFGVVQQNGPGDVDCQVTISSPPHSFIITNFFSSFVSHVGWGLCKAGHSSSETGSGDQRILSLCWLELSILVGIGRFLKVLLTTRTQLNHVLFRTMVALQQVENHVFFFCCCSFLQIYACSDFGAGDCKIFSQVRYATSAFSVFFPTAAILAYLPFQTQFPH